MPIMANEEEPVLHVVVVGFHHKKGCQVEYSYPPLVPGSPVDSNQLPVQWKHLPSLALPDGAHNYDADTIFFHLPSRTDPETTIYGVSCYRQMDASKLVNRGSDVTRNTVQKSVCVLSRLPLYGLIQAKLELITHAYFRELDFSQVSLLEDTYSRLNTSLKADLLKGSQAFLGLSARGLIQQFRHKVLVLFKLMMLERRVLFYSSPASPICSTVLSVLALFPGMIESGLSNSASYRPKKSLSQTLKLTSVGSDSEDYLEIHYKDSACNSAECSDNLPSVHSSSSSFDASVVENSKASRASQPSSVSSQKDSTSEVGKTGSVSSAAGTKSSTSSLQEETVATCEVAPLKLADITHIQRVQSKDGLQNDATILENSRRLSEKTDPLQFVEDITQVQNVQKPHSSSSLDEAYSPDFTVEGNVEDLLDNDECFSWEDSKGKLQIDTPLEESSENSTFAEESTEETSEKTIKETPEVAEAFDDVCLEAESNQSDEKSDRMLRTDSVDSQSSVRSSSSTASNLSAAAYMLKHKISSAIWSEDENKIEMQVMRPVSPTTLPADEFGMPLTIFTKGVLCHPYLSLQYYDLLQDVNIRGFVVGATNILFRQKHNLLDVVVDISESKIQINDVELRKQLNLTTADLRFAEYIVSHVTDEKGDHFLDDTEWEGGEEWVREQFRVYLLSLLNTLKFGEERLLDDFGPQFVAAWKTTNNYRLWQSREYPGLTDPDSQTGHPYHGQLSMSDMKLKLSHTLSNSDKGKRVNAAMGHAGKAVVQTGKVVGGALTSAKSAMSSWFSGFNKDWKVNNQPPTEQEEENVS